MPCRQRTNILGNFSNVRNKTPRQATGRFIYPLHQLLYSMLFCEAMNLKHEILLVCCGFSSSLQIFPLKIIFLRQIYNCKSNNTDLPVQVGLKGNWVCWGCQENVVFRGRMMNGKHIFFHPSR